MKPPFTSIGDTRFASSLKAGETVLFRAPRLPLARRIIDNMEINNKLRCLTIHTIILDNSSARTMIDTQNRREKIKAV
jgi:hypothetical protein